MRLFAPLNSSAHPQLQEIEIATFFQLPSFQIIGLPAPEVAEAKERIRSAVEASGFSFPRKRVVLNLSPASVKKQGTGMELAMALGVLRAGLDDLPPLQLAAWGELGLDGRIKAVGQTTRALLAALEGKLDFIFLSPQDFEEARETFAWMRVSGLVEKHSKLCLVPAFSLQEAWTLLIDQTSLQTRLKSLEEAELAQLEKNKTTQKQAHIQDHRLKALLPLSKIFERILSVSVAGRHHLLLLGPKGAGKSQAIDWVLNLQPEIAPKARLLNQLLLELCPNSETEGFWLKNHVPFRRVSSLVRPAALAGGITPLRVRPGEFSRAHGGVLVADELPEWQRDSRELLREPLERRQVSLSRAHGSVDLPADFVLAANGNLCPCGGWPSQLPLRCKPEERPANCQCSENQRRNYRSRLSGPILDRIDIVILSVNLTPPYRAPEQIEHSNSTASVARAQTQQVRLEAAKRLKKKVLCVRERLVRAWGKPPGELSGAELEEILSENPSWQCKLASFQGLSLRSRHKLLRLVLSFSAWDGYEQPQEGHWQEAAQFRAESAFYFNS